MRPIWFYKVCLVYALLVDSSSAQHYPEWSFAEGAKARLGVCTYGFTMRIAGRKYPFSRATQRMFTL